MSHHPQKANSWFYILKAITICCVILAIISMILILSFPSGVESLQLSKKKTPVLNQVDLQNNNKNSTDMQGSSLTTNIESINNNINKQKTLRKDVLEIFLGKWCGTCLHFAPVVEKHLPEIQSKYKNLEVIIHNCELKSEARACGPVSRFPTVLLFKYSSVADTDVDPEQIRFPGPFNEDGFLPWINKNLAA